MTAGTIRRASFTRGEKRLLAAVGIILVLGIITLAVTGIVGLTQSSSSNIQMIHPNAEAMPKQFCNGTVPGLPAVTCTAEFCKDLTPALAALPDRAEVIVSESPLPVRATNIVLMSQFLKHRITEQQLINTIQKEHQC